MKKREWLLVITLIFVVWGIDYATKAWAVYQLSGFPIRFWGPFGLVLHKNPGAMLGTFSNLPPILRIVTLSTGGAFLIFIYSSIQYLLPKKSLLLRSGMSILLGGILGNVTDRILSGSVVDFLIIRTPFWMSPAFNLADALQWVGYLMIVYTLIVHGEQIWPSQDTRKNIWVIPKFQIKYIFVLISVGFGFAIISGVFAFTFLKITIDELALHQSLYMEEKFLTPFLVTYSSISFAFIIVLFLIGRIVSHRTAGPIYAFELYVDDLIAGKNRRFKVRAGDELVHLEDIAERLRQKILPEGQFTLYSLDEVTVEEVLSNDEDKVSNDY
ncbi:MAG: signal peptidase II [Bdellovibrionales bacterium]|nr:signal peptidase II [Bdellovibrionales bacterium]